jgi:hypothetical protein
MATKIHIKHSGSGLIKETGYGYSWTYLFFGFFVPMFRGELGISVLHLLFSICTGGIFNLIFEPFFYNKQYMIRMLTSGWELAGNDWENKKARVSIGMEVK